MEGGGVCEIPLHRRPAGRPRLGEPDPGDRPSDGRLPGQPRRSPIPLHPRGRQDCSARDRAVSFDLELTGRHALVTAGTKGIGAAVVEVLHNAGATVVATARAIPADAPTDVHDIAADITTAAGCATVAQGVLDRLGGIDILVHVLGGSNAPAGGFPPLDDETGGKGLDLNLIAPRRPRPPPPPSSPPPHPRGHLPRT